MPSILMQIAVAMFAGRAITNRFTNKSGDLDAAISDLSESADGRRLLEAMLDSAKKLEASPLPGAMVTID